VVAVERVTAADAAARIVGVVSAAIATHGHATLALAGGATPLPVYRALAADPWRDAMPWPATRCFWGDERWVPFDHEENNAHAAIEACLAHVPVDPAAVHRIPTDLGQPEAAAAAYATLLASRVRQVEGVPALDLLLLGMGVDGHVLSLFPHSAALAERDRSCVAVPAPAASPEVPRITLTPPVVAAAAQVLVLVSGTQKEATLARLDAEATDVDRYPIHLLRTARGTITWLSLIA
jgi:6-phosphogluconolactonase